MSATDAYYPGDIPGLAGFDYYGGGGRGTLGSLIPSTGTHGPGYMYASLDLPADANDEFYGVLGTLPAGLTLTANEDSGIEAAANDGTYRVPFELYKAGTFLGSTYFDLVYGVVASTETLTGTDSTQASASSSGAVTVTPANSQTGSDPVTVPASRTAFFAGLPRVVVFDGKAPIARKKGALDELYFVGDFTKDLSDSATTAVSVAPVSVGVAVLEGPELQGDLGIVKLGALDTAAGARNAFTFRVACANGEIFDRTIELTALDDQSWKFGKDPDDHRLYAFDFGADAAYGSTALDSSLAPAVVGVAALSAALIQGNLAIVMLGGLDVADGATNSCGLAVTFANTEKISRTIYFTEEEH